MHDSNFTENYGILPFELQLSKNSGLHQIKTGNPFDKYLANVLKILQYRGHSKQKAETKLKYIMYFKSMLKQFSVNLQYTKTVKV